MSTTTNHAGTSDPDHASLAAPPNLTELPIGRRVAYFRTQRRLSQQILADLLGRSKSWLDKVERGERGLDKLSVICTIAAVLDLDVRLLLSEQLEPAPAAAVRRPPQATNRLMLGAARREVDHLVRRHPGPAAADRHHLTPLPQLLTWVYAAMAAEGVEPSRRHRVITTVYTLHGSHHDPPNSADDEAQPGPP